MCVCDICCDVTWYSYTFLCCCEPWTRIQDSTYCKYYLLFVVLQYHRMTHRFILSHAFRRLSVADNKGFQVFSMLLTIWWRRKEDTYGIDVQRRREVEMGQAFKGEGRGEAATWLGLWKWQLWNSTNSTFFSIFCLKILNGSGLLPPRGIFLQHFGIP